MNNGVRKRALFSKSKKGEEGGYLLFCSVLVFQGSENNPVGEDTAISSSGTELLWIF